MRSCDFNCQARAGEIKKSVAFVRTEFNVLGVRCIICIPVHRYVLRDAIRTKKREKGDVTFFFSVFGRKHVDQVGDVPLAEFFEFQLITRCKRERREIYVPHFVCRDASRDLGFRCTEQLRNISDCEFRPRRCASKGERMRENERRYVFISHTRMSDWTQISKITRPVAAS